MPELSIGEVSGTVDFGRIVGIVPLPGGSLGVGDASTNQIQVFDTAGRLVQTIGRRGAGPGEFEFLHRVGPYSGDSLWASDQFSPLVTIIDDSGRFGRRFRVELPVADTRGIYFADRPHTLGALGSAAMAYRYLSSPRLRSGPLS